MSKGNRSLAALIRREMVTESNARFLRSLPAFKVDRQIPARFQDLLTRLDRAERDGGDGRKSR
jgi:hypothetical protein